MHISSRNFTTTELTKLWYDVKIANDATIIRCNCLFWMKISCTAIVSELLSFGRKKNE